MKILQINQTPLAVFPYFHASPRTDLWGNQGVLKHDLPILLAKTDLLPKGLDALVMTSDLQGLVVDGDERRLVGAALPGFLADFISQKTGIETDKTGIVLAGDFFAKLESRGGLGDVRHVWRAFRDRFRWVVGVGGNHDDFGNNLHELPKFRREPGIFYLENEEIWLDDLRIGGISGVAGENGKHLRVPEIEMSEMLRKRLDRRPDLMLMHQNPFHESTAHKGGKFVLDRLDRAPGQLLVCGHAIWDEPFFELKNGAQVLNAGERVFILTR